MTTLMDGKPKRWLNSDWLKAMVVLFVIGTAIYLGSNLINKILESPLRNYLDKILIILLTILGGFLNGLIAILRYFRR